MWYKILFYITVPNLEAIWLHLGELWAKNHSKAPQNGIFSCSENIWTFITWQQQMVYSWNLPHLCISMRPFIWHKIGASETGGKWAWLKNNQKMLQSSQTSHFNLTLKQFEKRYEGRVSFTIIFNHLTLVLIAIEGEGECPPRKGVGLSTYSTLELEHFFKND